eukprot:GHVQ01040119.1.p2 GENE.GHVQ01040119.1~~GHVQ01040119.1.p2  ORF type:complete len:130 (+),score=7.39 GHVQ01040119.1:486-875(+)
MLLVAAFLAVFCSSILDGVTGVTGVHSVTSDTKSTFNVGTDNAFSDCFRVPHNLCIGGTSEVIEATKSPDDLIGWWTFDDIYPIDKSGNHNHMHPAIRSGPAPAGYGASGDFRDGFINRLVSQNALQQN